MVPSAICGLPENALAFSSSDPDEVLNHVGRTLAPHRMKLDRPAEISARLGRLAIARIELVDIQYGTDVQIDAGVLESDFLIHASIGGATTIWSGETAGRMRGDNLFISSPGVPARFRMSRACRHLTARISAHIFENYLETVMNIPVKQPLVFHPGGEAGGELPQAWRQLLAHVIQQSCLAPSLISTERMARQYSCLMVEMLLSNFRNSYSDRIALSGNDVAPWYVRKARALIHETEDDSLSVSELAVKTGVSARSLQEGFRRFLGVTPAEYVRRHRLERLHEALLEAAPESSVTALMLDCGITSFGRYAQYYRHRYGCRPSDTLRGRPASPLS